MIQFLKSSDGRHGSVRHADPADQPPVCLESTEPEDLSAEHSALTDEEAAEIRRAFQRQPSPANGLSEEDGMNHTLAGPSTVSLISYDAPVASASTSSDICVNDGTAPNASDDRHCAVVNQLLPEALMRELEELAATAEPAINHATPDNDLADQAVTLTESAVDAPDSTQVSIDVLNVPKGTEIVPHPDTVKQLAIEHILIEGLAIGDAANGDAAVVESDCSIDAIEQLAIAAGQPDIAADTESSSNYEEHQTGPLTYFQYYLNEDANGPGGTAAKPADYVSPVRHTTIPSGLIGASVLGVTLVSGFVIADTLKTQSFTGAKKPAQPSQRPPLAPKTQATGMLVPQVIPPEAMPPEVELPQPKESKASIASSNPVFPPLPPLATPRPAAPIQIAMAPTPPAVSAVLPQRSAVDEITAPRVAAPQPPSTPPQTTAATATPSEVAVPLTRPATSIPLADSMPSALSAPTQMLPQNGPQVLPPTNDLSVPEVTERSSPAVMGTEIEVPQPSQAELPSPMQPANRQPLTPQVPAGIVAPTAQVDLPIAENATAARQPAGAVASTSTLAFDTATSGLRTAQPSAAAENRSSTPSAAANDSESSFNRLAAIVNQPSSMAMPSGTGSVEANRIDRQGSQFTSAFSDVPDAAVEQPAVATSTTAPTVQLSSADQTSVEAQMQQLLTAPEYRGYLSPSNQWRSLTRREANVAARAEQLGAFTRQELNQQDYIRAYRLVSQQVDALPPFGFIDYQRKLILLPPDSATALNEVYQGQSQDWRHNSSRNGQANSQGAIAS